MYQLSCVRNCQCFVCTNGDVSKNSLLDLFSGIFGEKIGRALQKIHEKNGAKFYSEVNVTELTVS